MGRISFWFCAFVLCAGGCTLASRNLNPDCQSVGSWEVASALSVDKDVSRSLRVLPYAGGPMLKEEFCRIQAYGDLAVPALVRGLADAEPDVRSASAYLLGEIGNPLALPALKKRETDPVSSVRYEAATARISLGDWGAAPILFAGLREQDLALRFRCFEVLNEATGLSFGYEYAAAPEKRNAATDLWQDWWNSVSVQRLAQAHSP